MTPRGIRNNNPGNIRITPTPWQGKTSGEDPEFETFITPHYGLRALAKVLLSYQDKHGIRTVRGVIFRWAPPKDHNDSMSYAQHVAAVLGVDLDDQIDLHREMILLPIVMTIIRHENSNQQPYSAGELADAIHAALEVS